MPVVVPEPVTRPAVDIVATVVVTLLHTPPPVASDNVSVKPSQIGALPRIAAGNGFTVTIAVCKQPVPNSYVIIAVPADTPVTPPVALTVAEPVLLHVPLPVASVKLVVEPTQTLSVPVIAAGAGFTVTTVVVVIDPHAFVAV